MKCGRTAFAMLAAGALGACDLVFDPGPPAASSGPTYLFTMTAVRPALEVCVLYDEAFTRNHVVTVNGNKATIQSEGSPDILAPKVAPGVYWTEIMRDQLRMTVAFDDQAQTRTLVITEVYNGCRWTGESRGPDGVPLWVPTWPKTTGWWRQG